MTKKEDGTFNLSDKKVKFWTDEINSETADKKRDLERELEKKARELLTNSHQATSGGANAPPPQVVCNKCINYRLWRYI